MSQVDVLEKQAKEVLRQVRSLRNLVQPANRLPPELLTSCATFVSDADPRPIVPLTHVCRYWRESINRNARNWKSIGANWKKLVPLCLERAGEVPLVVDIVVPDSKGDETFLNALLPHVPRIGSLRLTGYSSAETLADDLPGFFASPILRLTTLELQQTAVPTQLFPSDHSPIPPPFLVVSKLKSLSLTQTPLYPTLFNITSLVELKLIGYTNPFHFGTFLELLISNPSLELVVLDIQFTMSSVVIPPARKAPLPRLQHLSITCFHPIDSRGLLSCISLPRGVHLDVQYLTQMDQPPQLGSFLPSPPTSIHDLLAPITTIKTQLTPQEFHLSGNGSVFTFRSPNTPRTVHWELMLFPCAGVRELHTNIYPFGYNDVGISRVLAMLPALETLAISKTPFPHGLLSALTEVPVLCPALRTIAFFDGDINSSIIKELGEAITKRRDSTTTRLYRVVIVNSTGAPPDLTSIKQLRKCVPCVEVRVDDKLPDLS